MASTSGPAPTRTVTVPQIKTAEVPKKLQEGEEFIKWDEVRGEGSARPVRMLCMCTAPDPELIWVLLRLGGAH